MNFLEKIFTKNLQLVSISLKKYDKVKNLAIFPEFLNIIFGKIL
jgi:hypothetical protein